MITDRARPKVADTLPDAWAWARSNPGKVNASPQAPPRRSTSRRLMPLAPKADQGTDVGCCTGQYLPHQFRHVQALGQPKKTLETLAGPEHRERFDARSRTRK
jgi:hypothetical protein